MAYGVYSDRGYREHILEKNKNTNKTEVFTQEDQTFTGRKTFLSGITTSDLEVQTVEVSESLKIKGKDITEVIDYLPNDVSKENKLTTEDFVNSSIATNTAYFIGTFASVEDLEAYEGEKTNNDYAFVRTADEFGAISFNRYKYNSQSESWEYEYTLNNSSFTAAQWDAINSGITEELVSQIGQGGGSALVPSITQEQYNNLTEAEKNNGQIREITDTLGNEIPFVILDDTLNTASNVLSAQKVNELFGYELGQNENGHYLKCANGLLVCWGETVANLSTINLPYPYRDNKYVAFGNIFTTISEPAYTEQVNIKQKTNTSVIFPATTESQRQFFTFGYWK